MTPYICFPLFQLVVEGQYLEAWRYFQALPTPQPLELRFAGNCLHHLGRSLEAKDLLIRAVANGAATANIELATLYRLGGEFDKAEQALAHAPLEELEAFDRTLALRERGALAYALGQLPEARRILEAAWRIVNTTEFGERLRPGIAQALAFVANEMGLEAEAVHYCDIALSSALIPRRALVLATKALALTNIGQFEVAQASLDELRPLQCQEPLCVPFAAYVQGLLYRAQGFTHKALETFRKAAEAAHTSEDRETECFVRAQIVMCQIALGELNPARSEIAKVSKLAQSAKAQAHLALCEGSLFAALGTGAALPRLEAGLEQFRQLGLKREEGLTWLHIAQNHLLQENSTAATYALENAMDCQNLLEHDATLAFELWHLPDVHNHLEFHTVGGYAAGLLERWQHLERTMPARLHLETLGAARLIADGQPIKFKHSQTEEFLAYLLKNPNCTRGQLLSALKPDTLPSKAANYLHQLRNDVEHRVKGLSIAFDETTKLYSVKTSGARLTWDVAQLETALGGTRQWKTALELYKGEFLPEGDNEWVEGERQQLKWSLTRFIETELERLNQNCDFENAVTIAKQFLILEPDHYNCAKHYIHAMERLYGAHSARSAFREIVARNQAAIGEASPELLQLEQQLNSQASD